MSLSLVDTGIHAAHRSLHSVCIFVVSVFDCPWIVLFCSIPFSSSSSSSFRLQPTTCTLFGHVFQT